HGPGHRRVTDHGPPPRPGWVLLMEAVAPFGDMINVLAHDGPLSAALGVHGLTSAFIAVTGLLVLRETGRARSAPVARAA
ncbi:DUF4267 domain-containing protein, partial [Streptomyces sp. DT225]